MDGNSILLQTTVRPNGYSILCLSDTHGLLNKMKDVMPSDVDIVVHAGDLTCRGEERELQDFMKQISCLPAPLKLFIAGNHELSLDRNRFLSSRPSLYRSYDFDAESDTPENYYNKCVNIVQPTRFESLADSSLPLSRYLLDEEFTIYSENNISRVIDGEQGAKVTSVVFDAVKVYGSP
jgi:3',5'-cyclic AMP phosphodiesterase CpdA